MLRSVSRFVRWSDWSTSKLPFVVAVSLLLSPASPSLIQALETVAILTCWASFGYALNDWCDRDHDRRAGKTNSSARISNGGMALLLGSIVIATLALGLELSGGSRRAIALASLPPLLAIAYSMPPLRLKERGAGGLITGAVAQWFAPIASLTIMSGTEWSRPEVWVWALLGTAIGIRWMTVHQVMDAAADRVSGTRTFVTAGGRSEAVLKVTLLGEIALLGIALASAWPRSLALACGLVLWTAWELYLRPIRPPFSRRLASYDSAPGAEFYFLILPVVTALGISLSRPGYVLIAIGFALVGRDYAEMLLGETEERFLLSRRAP